MKARLGNALECLDAVLQVLLPLLAVSLFFFLSFFLSSPGSQSRSSQAVVFRVIIITTVLLNASLISLPASMDTSDSECTESVSIVSSDFKTVFSLY